MIDHDKLLALANRIESLAFAMPPPNDFTPQFVELAIGLRALAQPAEAVGGVNWPAERIKLILHEAITAGARHETQLALIGTAIRNAVLQTAEAAQDAAWTPERAQRLADGCLQLARDVEASKHDDAAQDADDYWRDMYRIERAMRFMDVGMSREGAFTAVDKEMAHGGARGARRDAAQGAVAWQERFTPDGEQQEWRETTEARYRHLRDNMDHPNFKDWECRALYTHPQTAPAQGDDETAWREGWAMAYCGAALYGDDGELQDNRTFPPIDFRHDSAMEIRRKIHERGMRALAASPSPEVGRG